MADKGDVYYCRWLKTTAGSFVGWEEPPPPCFFVGDNVDFNLCMPRKRWRSLKGKQGARGLSFQQLGVVDECNCDPNPDIPTLDETAEFRRQFGFKRKLDRAALAELTNRGRPAEPSGVHGSLSYRKC